jgi:hypothetical protein
MEDAAHALVPESVASGDATSKPVAEIMVLDYPIHHINRVGNLVARNNKTLSLEYLSCPNNYI